MPRIASGPSSSQALVDAYRSLRAPGRAKQAGIVVGASLVTGRSVCARHSASCPVPRCPLTLQNFGVLAVALTLGSRRGFAALALYLAGRRGAGLPVFSPSILGGGIAQILGPTGGFLIAYPFGGFCCGLDL